MIEELVQVAGKEKMQVKLHAVDENVNQEVRAYAKDRLVEAVKIAEKHARQDAIDAINEETVAYFEEKYIESPELIADVKEVLHDIVKEEVRRLITHEKFVRTAVSSAKSGRSNAISACCRAPTVPVCLRAARRKL
ncbi:hypothetical protein HMSSN036_36130 [Paenibacillus macerans]|nr:hypothetical protein HMSSN036_36130 [Paenibacillus macerans]